MLINNNSFAAVRTSQASGNWSVGATWVGGVAPATGDDAIIVAGTNVTASNDQIVNCTLDAGGVITIANAKDLTVTGNLILNGTLTSGGPNTTLTFTGAGKTIDGLGSITLATGVRMNANMSALSTANFTVDCPFTIANGVVFTNNGTVTFTSTVGNDLIGSNATSEWINAANSYVKFANVVMATGKLTASASGNTVEYYGVTQTVKAPTGNYYNLILSVAGTKTLGGTIALDGSLNINSATLDVSTFDISLKGNWTNTGTFTMQTRTVTFNGTSDQTITNASGETFYNLTKNSAANLLLANNVIVSNTLTMSAGNIDAQANKITLGTGIGAGLQGTLTYTAGSIIGNFERWIIATGTAITFPVGTSSNVCTATPTFTNLVAGSLIVNFSSSAPGNAGLSLVDGATTVYNTFVEGYWTFTAANSLSSTNYDLQLTGGGFSSFTITAATRILTRANSASNWTAIGTHVNAAGTTAKRTALSGASNQFAFGDNTNCTAPVTSAITGTSAVCTNQNGVAYSVTNTAGSTYAWTITGGTQASGTNTNSITVNWGAVGMAGNVRVVETNTCTSGPAVDFPVTIASLPTSSITGSINVAQNTNGVPYSVTNTADYTYSWTITGGTQASGTNTNSITVDWGAAGAGLVSVTATNTVCGTPSSAVNLAVNVYVVINSVASGLWSSTATWDCVCVPTATNNVDVKNGHAITFPNGTAYSITNLIIDVGGTINNTSNQVFTVSGDFINNGNYTGNIGLTLNGSGTSIDGIGTISLSVPVTIASGNKNILSTAVLTRSAGTTVINTGITVTNYGNFTTTTDIVGNTATSTWINAANSTLNMNGGVLLATGTFNSAASGNSTTYGSAGAQNIKVPSGSYYNLTLSGGSFTKTLLGNITVAHTLTNSAIIDPSASNYSINIEGDWITNSAAATPMVSRASVVTFDGTSAQTIGGTVASTFNSLTINNSIGISLSKPVNVNGALTLTSGNITTTAANILTMAAGSSATSGSASGYVNGPMAKIGTTAFTFPVGKGGQWSRIAIGVPTASETFTAEYFKAGYGTYTVTQTPNSIDHVSQMEYWTLTRAGAANATVQLFWENASNSIITDCADLRIAHWNGSAWENNNDAVTVTSAGCPNPTTQSGNIVTNVVVSSFSPFTFASKGGPNPLPVDLLSFEAKPNGNDVDVTWSTASEFNSDYFVVQRSKDGINFTDVKNVDAFGNSSTIKKYSAVDDEPYNDVSYYRLKQVDYDGKFALSDVVAVKLHGNDMISVYPNPSVRGEALNVSIAGQNGKEVLIVVRDLQGREFYSKVVLIFMDREVIAIDPSGKLVSGVYFIVATSDNNIYEKKIVIK